MMIEENIPLAPLTTFHLGGPARFFVRVKTAEDLRAVLAEASSRRLATLILGGGSNLLVDDRGFDGLVIKIELAGVQWERVGDKTLLVAGAGEEWDALVKQAVAKNLWGIENLSGIPGTMGAAPVQNIGAYGAELKDTLAWVEALDLRTGDIRNFPSRECGFGYRTSLFKKESGRFITLRVALLLGHDSKPNLSYRDVGENFRENSHPTLAQIRSAVLTIRAGKFPDVAQEGTAGSFFLNPIVPKETARELKKRYPEMPQFDTESGVKLPLAWILDKALGVRGLSHGCARLFEKQPLVIVAQKNCSAEDVKKLSELVQEKIKKEIGIEIEKEVRII